MTPEAILRLRLLGFSPEGIRKLQEENSRHGDWLGYVEVIESFAPDMQQSHANYWNSRGMFSTK